MLKKDIVVKIELSVGDLDELMGLGSDWKIVLAICQTQGITTRSEVKRIVDAITLDGDEDLVRTVMFHLTNVGLSRSNKC